MEDRRLEHGEVAHAADAREDLGHRDRVVDVRRGAGALAALVAVLVGGEVQGVEERGVGQVGGAEVVDGQSPSRIGAVTVYGLLGLCTLKRLP